MNLADYVIPGWLKWSIAGVLASGLVAAGYQAGRVVSAAEVASASVDAANARAELAGFKGKVATEAAEQAETVVTQVVKQTRISQEGAGAYIQHRGALDQRIAAGGLGLRVSNAGIGLRIRPENNRAGADSHGIRTAAGIAAGATDGATQSLPAGAGGNPDTLSRGMAEALPATQQVTEDAARDAQQLAELIDTACKLGLCPSSSGPPPKAD